MKGLQKMKAPALYLKKREERRILGGHPWVFSNEVDVERSPLSKFEAGEPVDVRTHTDKWVGSGYVNPNSLICARLVSQRPEELLGPELLKQRISRAIALRERLFSDPYYRLVFGEGDGLPGLVVDRYGAVLVVQIGTAGMERFRTDVVAILDELLRPDAIVLRNDVPSRMLEGLDSYVETPVGTLPERTAMVENGVRFEVLPILGQKTGWYFDQRSNRRRTLDFVDNCRVLDVCCYSGGFGVQAAAAGGASHVLCVDTSERALEQVQRNAALNEVEAIVNTQRGDVFQVLKGLRSAGERFDVVILDPPAFIPRRKDVKAGIEAYRRLNGLGLQLLVSDGILVSASCSFRLHRDTFLDILCTSARGARRTLQILGEGHQGEDHPVHPALPESNYLKVFFARAL